MISIKKAIEQIEFENDIINVYKRAYSHFPKQELDKLLLTGKKIASRSMKDKNISLIVGQVQSGKTSTFLSVIAHAFDAGSNFIVVTPAIDNVLMNQTYERICNTFGASIDVFLINDLMDKKQVDPSKIYESLKNGRKTILVSLKHTKRLNDVKKVMIACKKLTKKSIIFDDEGDQASFDNKNSEEAAAVFSAISSLYRETDASMIAVTATPMPQIFVNNNYALKPDWAFYAKPGKGYMGIEEYMDEENHLVIPVEQKEYTDLAGEKAALRPKKFKESILYFLTMTAIAHLIDEDITTKSMLMHIERKKQIHKTLKLKINAELKSIKKKIQKLDSKTIDQINSFIKTTSFDIDASDDLIKLILLHIDRTEIRIINGDNPENEESLMKPLNKNYIYLGSAMLQRGVTIKNLIVTYFVYRSSGTLNADTVLQRARWFGYKENYKDVLRVYMTEEAISDFKALNIMTPDMIERLVYAEEEDMNFKEFERSIILPYANLKATRDSVIKNGRSKLSRFITNYSFKSMDVAEDLFYRIQKTNTVNVFPGMPFAGVSFSNYLEAKDWLSSGVMSEIFKEVNMTGNDIKAYEDFIATENPNFYIVNMYNSDVDYRERSFKGKTLSITQGHNNNYPGDRYWYKHSSNKFANSIIIQLFKIQDEDSQDTIYKVALVANKRVHGWMIHPED